jgi:hypothetical protein
MRGGYIVKLAAYLGRQMVEETRVLGVDTQELVFPGFDFSA